MKFLIIKKKSLTILGLLIVYKLLLDFWYITSIGGIFLGYSEPVFDIIKLIEAMVITSLAAYLFPRHWNTPSSFYYSILALAVIIPMVVLYTWIDCSRLYLYIVALAFVIIGIIRKLKRFRIPIAVNVYRIVLSTLTVCTLTALIWVIYATKANFIIDLTDTYKYRIEYRTSLEIGLWGYLITWVGKVFIPLFISIALLRKNKLTLIVLVAVAVSYFSLTTHKYLLVIGLFPLLLYALHKYSDPVIKSLYLLTSTLTFLYIVFLLFESYWIPALAVQRPILKPALLNFIYYDFFSTHGFVYYSNSVFSWLVEPPYDKSPPFLIGEYFKNDLETRSNTGFLGTGYAHFGLIGVIAFAVIIGLILRILDSVSHGMPVWFVIAITFGPFSSMLIAADLLSAIFTHGVLISLILIWAIRPNIMNYCNRYPVLRNYAF